MNDFIIKSLAGYIGYHYISPISLHRVKKHDIHIKPKSYKLELLGESVIQHGIRSWFGLGFESPLCNLNPHLFI